MAILIPPKYSRLIKAERISIRLFSTLILLISLFVAILVFFLVSAHGRNVAVELQKNSLSRVISVASDAVLVDLRKDLVNVGNSLQQRSEIRRSLKGFHINGDASALINQLDDPIINGFVGAADIDLVKLRVYDIEYRFIAESSRGIKGVTPDLPEFLFSEAKTRTGANRLKALGGLWTDEKTKTALYSFLVPIGGLKVLGYLEVVINPLFNLMDISKATQRSLTIYNPKGEELSRYSIEDSSGQGQIYEEIEYTLKGNDNKSAFRIISYDDVSEFNQNMSVTRMAAVGGFIIIFSAMSLISLFLMNRYLFKPMQHMVDQLARVSNGDFSKEVDNRGLKDFHELALSFNTMREIVQVNMENLERISFLDGLTGIGNRRYFDQMLDKEWHHNKRTGNSLSLIICDIDFFKQFNDAYGHLAGDECIQQVTQAIVKATHRPTDLACRYGGEEFAIILPDTPIEGALHISEMICQLVDELGIAHNNSLVSRNVTLSMGIATAALKGVDSSEGLISAADIALYQAKNSGRNQVKIAKDGDNINTKEVGP